MGQVNVIPQVYKNNFVKAVLDNSGNIDHLTCAAGDVGAIGSVNTPRIYQLGGQPYPWHSDQLKVGDNVLIDSGCLSGFGKRVIPIKMINCGDVLIPDGEQVIYSGYGSYGSPIATVTPPAIANTEKAFFSASKPILPYLLIYKGLGIRVRFKAFKNDADTLASTFRCRFGTSSGDGNNNMVAQDFTAAAAGSEIDFDRTFRITSLGDVGQAVYTTGGREKLYSTNIPANNYSGDKNTLFSTAVDNYFSFTHTINNTTGGAALLNFSISLVP